MNPYTPGTKQVRKKQLGLSKKEYSKVTNTIKSIRRRDLQDNLDDDIDIPNHISPTGHSAGHNDSSFIAETSFVRAPLNSRVVSSSNAPKPKGKGRQESLDRVPLDIQQALILEDLLFVLMGIEGTYITYHPEYSPEEDDPLQGILFVLSPSLDSSLSDLVERILPLGTYYTAISAFIENRSHLECGLVNHALSAAIREMLRDYQTLLAQLEHSFNSSPSFSLQKLWFYVHPTVHSLSLIYQLILELTNAEDPGADLLSSESSSEEDPEEEARNDALGLGGAKLKAVLSEMNNADITGLPDGSGIAVKGGEVLTIIYERMQNMSGDPTAAAIYGKLLKQSGKPYVEMLRDWVSSGRLIDPYEELLVKESKFIDRGILDMDYVDEYWERRYTLRDGSISLGSSKRHQTGIPAPRSVGGRLPGGACISPLLESWKHKILLAGKYLNVIRECGIDVPRDHTITEDEELSMENERFYKFIEDAYSHANRTLLQLLLKDQQLIPRLRSLKRYFFLSQSSFLTHLLDLASTELRKSSKSASTARLQNLLDLALNTDSGGEDPLFKEDIKITMADTGLYEFLLKVVTVSGVVKPEETGSVEEESKKERDDKKSMQAMDALTIDYNVKFPLSLVISRKTILLYQLIFRFLLHLKHVEQTLSSMWAEQKSYPWRCPMPNHPEFTGWRLRVCLLRAKMLAFVQQVLAFITFEVLEPNWHLLEAKLEKVTTVDQLLRDHVDFLDTCMKACMLTSSKLIKACSKLIVVCQTFALYSASFTKSANQAIAAALEDPNADSSKAKRWDVLNKFETNFNHWFQVHLDCVQFYASSDNVALLPLVMRLNSVRSSA